MLHHSHTILASNCFVSKPLLDNIVFSVRESEHFTADSEQISAETVVNSRLKITGDLCLLILISSSHNQRENISLIVLLQLLHHYN